MLYCKRCYGKINLEQDKVAEKVQRHKDGSADVTIFRCPHCKQNITNMDVFTSVSFPNCVTKVKYIGLNSEADANALLKMMQEAAG